MGSIQLKSVRKAFGAVSIINGIDLDVSDGEFAVFELRGILLALFPIAQLACDGTTEPEPGTGGIRFTIGVMAGTAEQVDRLTDQMRQAGARLTKAPVDAEFFAGRSAYLCDPRVTTSRSPGPSPSIRSWRRPGASRRVAGS